MKPQNEKELHTMLLEALELEVVGEPNTPALVGRVRLMLKGALYQAGVRNPKIYIQQKNNVLQVRIQYPAGPKRVQTLQLSTHLI